LLYIKEDLIPTEFHTKTVYGEQVWCYIGDLLVGVCYRSRNSAIVSQDNETNLIKLLREVSSNMFLLWAILIILQLISQHELLLQQVALGVSNLYKPFETVFIHSMYCIQQEVLQ